MDGIDALYREHGLGLIRFALMLTGDQQTAEDVVQDAFLGLHRNWEQVRDPASRPAYLRTAVVNGARAVHRGRGRVKARRHLVPRELPVWSAEAAAIDDEDRRELLTAVARLPEHQREVLAMKFFLDLPEAEIAQALGVSRGTVSSRTARALAALSDNSRSTSDYDAGGPAAGCLPGGRPDRAARDHPCGRAVPPGGTVPVSTGGTMWLLPVNSAPGSATARAHKVTTGPPGSTPFSTALSADGHTMYVLSSPVSVPTSGRPRPPQSVTLSAYSTADSALLRTVHAWTGIPDTTQPSMMLSGNQLLVWGVSGTTAYQVDPVSGAAKPVWVYSLHDKGLSTDSSSIAW